MTHVVVDPVTRIEGHLRIEAQVDGGAVRDAWSSSTMFRGIEIILTGRDPRDAWAFTQRICGVCTTVHALASIRAVEDALDISVPKNADIIRNLMFLTQMVGFVMAACSYAPTPMVIWRGKISIVEATVAVGGGEAVALRGLPVSGEPFHVVGD